MISAFWFALSSALAAGANDDSLDLSLLRPELHGRYFRKLGVPCTGTVPLRAEVVWFDTASRLLVGRSRRGELRVLDAGLPAHLVAEVEPGVWWRAEVQWGPHACRVRASPGDPLSVSVIGLESPTVQLEGEGCLDDGPWTIERGPDDIGRLRIGWIAPPGGCWLRLNASRVYVRQDQADVGMDVRDHGLRAPPASPMPAARLGPGHHKLPMGPPTLVQVHVPDGHPEVALTIAGCGVAPVHDPILARWHHESGPRYWLLRGLTMYDDVHLAYEFGGLVPGTALSWPWTFACEARLVAIGDQAVWVGAPTPVEPGDARLDLDLDGARALTGAEARALLCAAPEDLVACQLLRVHQAFEGAFPPAGAPSPTSR